jgi:gas vesicle protein
MGRKDSGYRCSVGTVILSFFVGELIGTGVALLVAPKTGDRNP